MIACTGMRSQHPNPKPFGAGDPYSPMVLSRHWRDAVKAPGIRHIKLHAARHTCATLMHLSGVPVAVIAAWIGHKVASLTMRLYSHSQAEALKAAGANFGSSCDDVTHRAGFEQIEQRSRW
jgi:integrase